MPTDSSTSPDTNVRPTRRLAAPALAAGFVLVAIGLRALLGGLLPGLTVFALYYPAILAAGLIGGEIAAAVALALSFGASLVFLRRIDALTPAAVVVNMLLFFLTGTFLAVAGARLRALLERRQADMARLAEREARYRTLFEGVSEGFSLLEPVWGDDGGLADFIVLEANPALLAMFRGDASIFGRRQSELYGTRDPAYMAACERAFRGATERLEVPSAGGRRWFDVRISPVGADRVAQLVVDITERKLAEHRQVEMFDELNHRVKNNLAAVSAMLTMQARVAEHPAVREQLQKAVDRIETIGDVHDSLCRASSTDLVDFGVYLQRLCERLGTTIVDGERIRIEVATVPATAPLDEAVALGLIVNELVTNAAKYAYPTSGCGVIRVELRNAPGGLRLTVSDDGAGLPDGPLPGGIGMRLVRSLVQQCHGVLDVESKRGATFVVRLPRHSAPSESPQPAPL